VQEFEVFGWVFGEKVSEYDLGLCKGAALFAILKGDFKIGIEVGQHRAYVGGFEQVGHAFKC
jgi:hypothetical protein